MECRVDSGVYSGMMFSIVALSYLGYMAYRHHQVDRTHLLENALYNALMESENLRNRLERIHHESEPTEEEEDTE
jgi:hypothetical protein